MSVAESVPEVVEEETTEKLPPEEASAAAPRKLLADSKVKVRGKSIRISEFLKHYDPECPRRCKEGVVKVGRPNKTSPGGVQWIPELCDCTVKGWLVANPAPVAAGSLATAVLDRAERPQEACAPAPNPRAKQVSRLRERVSGLRQKLADVEADLGSAVGPLADALKHEELAVLEWGKGATEVGERLGEVRAQLEALVAEEKALVARAAVAEQLVAEATTRAAGIRKQIDGVRATRRRDTNPLLRDIERVGRRITRIVERHPDLAEGIA
jgi:hypothetical protein